MGNKRIYLLIAVIWCFSNPTLFSQEMEEVHSGEEGYKGIWFSLGQFSEYGDKYSGGLGTYTAKHIPLAIFAEEVNKTFFVYGGTKAADEKHLLCMAGSFDHETKMVSKPVIVHDKNGVDDPHDNPSISIDDEGHIWVFVSGRGRSRMGFKYKSTLPYDISSFERISEEEMTYPQPKYLPGKGFLNLFTKYTGMRELYFETSADGNIWSDDQKLVAIKREGDKNSGHYQVSGQYQNKVVFFCNWHPNGNVDLRTNLYYLQTEDFGKTWTDIQGKALNIPVTDLQSSALVRDLFGDGTNVYVKDVNFDENGYPMALYVSGKGHQTGPKNGPRSWNIIHWNRNEWENHKITESDQNYDSGSLWVEEDQWVVIGPTQNRPQPWGAGGELERWESNNKGKTWTRTKEITKQSTRNHNYVRRVVNGKDPFLYFWADGDPDKFSRSQLYFGDSEGKAWILPYEMEEEMVKPKRLPNNFFMRLFSR
ncbi:MAG: BNR-4 repeat-containing protein [Cyclobacteriaceae bacterium]